MSEPNPSAKAWRAFVDELATAGERMERLTEGLGPVEQAWLHTAALLNEHVGVGAWFAAIAAGYTADRFIGAAPAGPAPSEAAGSEPATFVTEPATPETAPDGETSTSAGAAPEFALGTLAEVEVEEEREEGDAEG